MENKKMNAIISVIGTFLVIGIILYKEKENVNPILILGMISALLLSAFLFYVTFYLKKKS